MRKLGLFSLLALVIGALPAGCGGGDDDDNDVIQLPADAGTADTGGQVDSGGPRGNVEDFDECGVDDDCSNTNSDCKQVGQFNLKVCMPRCDATADCPFNSYCYPVGGGALGGMFAGMGNHCWISLCGGQWGDTTGAACTLGNEAGIAAAQQLPGWCYPWSDGEIGICLEAGNVAAGGSCDFQTQTRGGANCDSSSICIGRQGDPTGNCAQLCDPAKILTAEPTGCTMGGQDCFDSSNVTTYPPNAMTPEPTVDRSTVGFCVDDIVACKTLAANTCPAAAGGEAQGCAPTNPVRPTGICDPGANGALAAGATCPTSGMPADAMQCTAGTICTGTCDKLCDIGMSPTVNCSTVGAGLTCKGLQWDDGRDMGDPADDNFTADWGTCQP